MRAFEGETIGEYAAKISAPGALTSGCNTFEPSISQIQCNKIYERPKSCRFQNHISTYLHDVWGNGVRPT